MTDAYDDAEIAQHDFHDYHKNRIGPMPVPPQGDRWWCAVHQRCLTYRESSLETMPRCAWCREPAWYAAERAAYDEKKEIRRGKLWRHK